MELPENEPYKRENFQYMFFAYWDTLSAPFTYDEKTKTYVAADNSVLSEGLNVVPFLAINRVDHSYSIYDDKNATIRSTLDAWLTYYKNAWCWTYGCFYQDYFAFYDCYNYYTDSLKYMSDHDMKMVAPQLHSSQRGADTGFFTMAAYVFAKLSWDSSLNMQTLIDNYMSAMFREADEQNVYRGEIMARPRETRIQLDVDVVADDSRAFGGIHRVRLRKQTVRLPRRGVRYYQKVREQSRALRETQKPYRRRMVVPRYDGYQQLRDEIYRSRFHGSGQKVQTDLYR